MRSAARKQRRARVGETSSWDHEAAAATADLEAAEDDEALSWSQPPTRSEPARGASATGREPSDATMTRMTRWAALAGEDATSGSEAAGLWAFRGSSHSWDAPLPGSGHKWSLTPLVC